MSEKRQAVVSKKEYLSRNVYKVRFSFEEKVHFKPGQFCTIVINDRFRRSYSIASRPGLNYIETYVSVSPGGIGSNFFEDLQTGDPVSMILPLGNFVYKSGDNPVYFICSGTGFTPLHCMLEYALESAENKREIKLIFGVRYLEDIYLQDRLDLLDRSFPNFEYVYCVSQNHLNLTNKKLFNGRVTNYLGSNDIKKEADVYICGNKQMVEDVRHICVDEIGIVEDRIHYEKY